MAGDNGGIEALISMVGPMLATLAAANRPLASSSLYGVNPGAAASSIVQPVSGLNQLLNFVLGTPQNSSMSPLSRIGDAPLSSIQVLQAKDNDLRFRQMQWAATKDAYTAGLGMTDQALRNWGIGDTKQFRSFANSAKNRVADSAEAPFIKQYGSTLALTAEGRFGMFTDAANRAAFANQQQFSRGGMYDPAQATRTSREAQRDLEQIRAFQSTGDISGKIESLLPDTRFTRGFSDMQLLQQRSFLRARGVKGLKSSSGLDAMAGAYKEASGLLGTNDVDEISRFIDVASGKGLTGTRVQDIQKAFRNLTTLATTLNVQVAGFSESVLRLQQGSATAGGLSGAAMAAGGSGLVANNMVTGGGAAMAARLSYMAAQNGISNEQMQGVFLAQKDDFRRSNMGRTLAYYNMQPDKTTYERLKAVALTGNAGAWDKAMQGALTSTFGSYTAGRAALADVRLQERMFGSWNVEEEGLVTMGVRNAARRQAVSTESAKAREKAAIGTYGAYAQPLEAQNVRAAAIIGSLSGVQRQMAERAFAGGGARQLDDLLRTQAFAEVRTEAETAGRVGLARHLENKFGNLHAEYGAVTAMSALAESPAQKKELQDIASAMRTGKLTQAQQGRLATLRSDPLMRAAWDAHMGADADIRKQAAARHKLEDENAKLDKLIGGKAGNDALFEAAAKNNTGVKLGDVTYGADAVQQLNQYRKEMLVKHGGVAEQYHLNQAAMPDEAQLAKNKEAVETARKVFEANNPGLYDTFKQSFGKFLALGDQKSLGALIGNDSYAPMLSLFSKLEGGSGAADVAKLREIGSDATFDDYKRRTEGKGTLTSGAFKELAAQRDVVLKGALTYKSHARDIFSGTYDDYVKQNVSNKNKLSQDDWNNGKLFMELEGGSGAADVAKLREIGSDATFDDYKRRTEGKGTLTSGAFKELAAQRDVVLKGALTYQSHARDIFSGTYDDYVKQNVSNKNKLSQDDWNNGKLFMELDTSETDNAVSKPSDGSRGGTIPTEVQIMYDGNPVKNGKIQISLHVDTSHLPAGVLG